MGVSGLWQVLEPHSKPMRLEMLSGKRIAIDASIWLHQFVNAMRDTAGEMLEGAHLRGFYQRILKLLFYGIKPV